MLTPKMKRVISIISEMDESRLDALLLLLQQPVGDDYELSDEDKWVINERAAKYKRGEDKGTPAREVSKQVRAVLKKRKK